MDSFFCFPTVSVWPFEEEVVSNLNFLSWKKEKEKKESQCKLALVSGLSIFICVIRYLNIWASFQGLHYICM